jgi:hypothetical protein
MSNGTSAARDALDNKATSAFRLASRARAALALKRSKPRSSVLLRKRVLKSARRSLRCSPARTTISAGHNSMPP